MLLATLAPFKATPGVATPPPPGCPVGAVLLLVPAGAGAMGGARAAAGPTMAGLTAAGLLLPPLPLPPLPVASKAAMTCVSFMPGVRLSTGTGGLLPLLLLLAPGPTAGLGCGCTTGGLGSGCGWTAGGLLPPLLLDTPATTGPGLMAGLGGGFKPGLLLPLLFVAGLPPATAGWTAAPVLLFPGLPVPLLLLLLPSVGRPTPGCGDGAGDWSGSLSPLPAVPLVALPLLLGCGDGSSGGGDGDGERIGDGDGDGDGALAGCTAGPVLFEPLAV